MSEANDGKSKGKQNFTLILSVDSKDGQVRQMEFGPILIESVTIIVIAAIVILSIICYRDGQRIEELTAQTQLQEADIVQLTEENADLISLREELTDKVVILSDTINQKVEEEEALAQERAQAHMPVGFPMSASASLEETDSEDKMVKLVGAVGSSIIASADGTVVSITTDSSYLHCVKIDHGNGYNSIYRNDGDVMIKEGDEVVRGAILFVIGEDNTELGYQITYDDKYVNPMELINIDG